MEDKSFAISLTKNPAIHMNVTPGHFTTSRSHVTHCFDLNNLKTNATLAREVAIELALPYISSALVDTIVCMEGTEVIGAYMAEELLQEGTSVINSGREIHVIVPMSNINRKLMFQSDMQHHIHNQNIILLVSSISGGTTIHSAMECLSYYGGILVGVSALFNAYPEENEQEIHSMFTTADIPDYKIYSPGECPMCKESHKLDGIIIHDGCTRI
jgi:orotate phosphoribosyltransferase